MFYLCLVFDSSLQTSGSLFLDGVVISTDTLS